MVPRHVQTARDMLTGSKVRMLQAPFALWTWFGLDNARSVASTMVGFECLYSLIMVFAARVAVYHVIRGRTYDDERGA